MPKKTHGLGRGLDSLFAGTEDWGTSIQEIPVGELDPNPDQPRRTFSAESISQLADSIREQGVLQPLLVAPAGGGRYMIIAGERRYRAGREAGLETLPCIVKDIDVIRQREIALIENLQREDLNPIEAAKGIRALMDQCGYTQEKVSARLGKSRPAIANSLRLLELPDEVKQLLARGILTAGHAKVLLSVEGERDRTLLARECAERALTVRELEKRVARMRNPVAEPKKGVPDLPESYVRNLVDVLHRHLGCAVRLSSGMTHANGKHTKGVLEIDFFDNDDLDRVLNIMGVKLD